MFKSLKQLKREQEHEMLIENHIGLTKETDERIVLVANKNKIKTKGLHHSPRTEFKKGMIPWNKNKKKLLSQRKRPPNAVECLRVR